MGEDRKREELGEGGGLPQPPRLPERAAIYIAPDGTVHFGALFEGLLPVAEALTARAQPPAPSLQPPAEKKAARPEAGDRGPGAA
jgi:hypothetical protein